MSIEEIKEEILKMYDKILIKECYFIGEYLMGKTINCKHCKSYREHQMDCLKRYMNNMNDESIISYYERLKKKGF